MKIGVTSCPQSSLKTKVKVQQTISRRLHLLDQTLYLAATNPSGFQVRRRQGQISCAPNKGPQKNSHKHHGDQRHCVLCNKAGMPERKYMSHSVEDCTGQRTNWTIKYGMGGSVWSRSDTMKQYKKSEKRMKDLKSLKKQNKMIYRIAKKSISRRELKKINNIWGKASKKVHNSSSDSSSDDSDSDSSLTSVSSWDTYRRPAGRKDTNKLDHIVTNNLKTNEFQLNEAINNMPTFYTNSFNLSSGNIDLLPVVNVSLQGGKKHRAKTAACLTCL